MNKRRLWKKGLAFFCIFLTAVLWAVPAKAAGKGTYVTAQNWPEGPEVASEGAILMDAVTGTILYEKNVDQQFYPASTTKIMTALLAIENCALEDVITYTEEDIYSLEPGASNIALRPGEQITVEQSLYGLLLASGNECANGLARKAAGSVSDFVDMMNERAAAIGCTNTHFSNPHGLHEEDHYTSPHDLALIMKEASKNSTYMRIASTLTYFIPETNLVQEQRPLKSTHQMMDPNSSNYYEGVETGKTGYTSSAGNTLVTYGVRDNRKLICVVMRSIGQQYTDTKALLDYGFSNFQMYSASSMESRYSVDGSEVFGSTGSVFQDSMLSVKFEGDSWVIAPRNVAFEDLETELVLETGGGSVGSVIYRYEGMQVGTASLNLEEAGADRFPFAVRSGFFLVDETGQRSLNIPFFIGLGVILLLAAVIVWRLFVLFRGKRKKGLRFKAKRKWKR